MDDAEQYVKGGQQAAQNSAVGQDASHAGGVVSNIAKNPASIGSAATKALGGSGSGVQFGGGTLMGRGKVVPGINGQVLGTSAPGIPKLPTATQFNFRGF